MEIKRGELAAIKEFLDKGFLDKFKVAYDQTLFPLNWESLVEGRCPVCSNKLKFPRHGKTAFCNGVKHKRTFVIATDKMNEVIHSLGVAEGGQ